MNTFKVIEIIDADTIKVSPNWVFKERKGDIIKVLGYSTPAERLQVFATSRLKNLIYNKDVELKDAQFVNPESTALFCRVFLNNVDISKYFLDFGNSH